MKAMRSFVKRLKSQQTTKKGRKLLSLLTLYISLTSISFAQSTANGKISGKVIDAATGTPVDFATVSIFKAGAASPFNGTSTDRQGNFIIDQLPEGKYRITIDFLGYQHTYIDSVMIDGKITSISLGNILLSPAQHQLKAVTITAKAPIVQNKIDRLVYNVADDLTSQGGVALDVLRKVPMVSVDIDGNVELQGNGNVRFLINGKPSSIFGSNLADALQAIPASQIKSIEVITSPGAKYDVEGTAGIINIVLKDSKVQGINGSINLSAGTRLENGSANLNARKGNWSIDAFFSGNDQVNSTTLNILNRQSFNNTRDTLGRLYQTGRKPFQRNGYQSGFSLNWNLSSKDELTGSMGFNHIGNHSTVITEQNQQTLLSSETVLTDINGVRNSSGSYGENAIDWSLSYKKTFKKEGQELNVLYTTSYGKTTPHNSQVSEYMSNESPATGLKSYNPGKDHQTDISFDYVQPVTKGFAVETGAKVVLENINEHVVTDTLLNNGTYIPNLAQTYSFNFTRHIYAGYISTSFVLFNDYLNGKMGIRYEHTNTSSDFAGVDIPLNNLWAPSLTVQHKLDETQSVKFGYSYRVQRPDYGDLNPFLNIIDPNNISTGNPMLKNEVGQKYELGYNKSFNSGGNIYAGTYYDHSTNSAQIITNFYPLYTVNGVDYHNVSLSQPENIGSQTTFGANIFGSTSIGNQLNLRSNIGLREQLNHMPGQPRVSGFSYKINLNATYQFEHNLIAEAFGNYFSTRKTIQSIRPAFFFYTIAVKKQFLNKKASVGITAANLFNQYVNQRIFSYGPNFNQSNVRSIPLRSFGVTLSYKFGKLEEKKGDKEDTPQIPTVD